MLCEVREQDWGNAHVDVCTHLVLWVTGVCEVREQDWGNAHVDVRTHLVLWVAGAV